MPVDRPVDLAIVEKTLDEKRRALVGETEIGGKRVLVMKPETYMNNSGEAIAEAMPEYGFIPDPIKDFKEAVKECDLIITLSLWLSLKSKSSPLTTSPERELAKVR